MDDSLSLLRSINGFDVDSALTAMGGMADLYIGTAKLTARMLPETIEKLDNYKASGDIESFTVEVHGLKTVLKNIGAERLGSISGRLERTALEGNTEYADKVYPRFRRELIEMLAHLEAMFPEKPETRKKTADKATLTGIIFRLRTSAESYDSISALELIAPHFDFTYGEEADKLLAEIIFALEAFNCEGALKKISELEVLLNDV
jgi:HPt (histidine-containing phosphotransfer) domain-containing protein